MRAAWRGGGTQEGRNWMTHSSHTSAEEWNRNDAPRSDSCGRFAVDKAMITLLSPSLSLLLFRFIVFFSSATDSLAASVMLGDKVPPPCHQPFARSPDCSPNVSR